MKLLLTGHPRAGKSTLVRRLLDAFPGNRGGFLSAAIKGSEGRRIGFELQVVWGGPGRRLEVVERALLAHVEQPFPWRVGRYAVNPAALGMAVQALDAAMHEGGLVIVDEIGPIQIASPEIQDALRRCLQSSCPLLGTVSQMADPFLDEVRSFPGVRLVEVTRHNRQHLAEGLRAWLRG